MSFLRAKLDELSERGLRRRTPEPEQGPSFCSNDYLGLASRRVLFAAEPAGVLADGDDGVASFAGAFADGRSATTGAGAARLIAGENVEHAELERAFANWLGVDACLAFTSGYAANVGAISALAGPSDLVVSDALNHASIIDGIRLSRARTVVTPHNDLQAIEDALRTRSEERAWVAVESYFSMDADGPDLGRLRALCDRYAAALYVDEAHALGILGPEGRGRCAEAGIQADVLVGTLGKSFGSQGAFVAGSSLLREWLWNRARSFVFSTGLAPASATAARLALEHAIKHPASRETALAAASLLRRGLSTIADRAKVQVLGFGHIVPIVIGPTDQALKVEQALTAQGLHLPAIRPPTVPEGTARLRITLTARHTPLDIDHLLTCLARSLSR